MISLSVPLLLASESTELLLALIATALRRRKAFVPSPTRNLLVAEVLEFALPLPPSHGSRLTLPQPPPHRPFGASPKPCSGPEGGATIWGMTAKEKVLEQAPDWTEEQSAAALLAAESTSESIVVEDNRPARPQDEARIRRLQEISERFRRIDWRPREDAWH
jgi:hypothetical protein